MKPMMRGLALAGVTLILAAGTMITTAQDQGGGQGRQGGGFGGGGRGGNFDPAQMQEMMLQRTQEDLGINDDEWTAIKPLVASVMEKQMQQGFRGMGFGGRRGGPGGGPGGPSGPGAQGGDNTRGERPRGFGPEPSPEEQALSAALESDSTSAEDLKAKLTAYRESQKKKAAELQKAREELRAVLTVRQEVQLVLRGMLD